MTSHLCILILGISYCIIFFAGGAGWLASGSLFANPSTQDGISGADVLWAAVPLHISSDTRDLVVDIVSARHKSIQLS